MFHFTSHSSLCGYNGDQAAVVADRLTLDAHNLICHVRSMNHKYWVMGI